MVINLVLLIGIFKSYDNVLRWMPQDLTDVKSTLVQVMACCLRASSHYLNQCWPRSPTPYGVTRPNELNHSLKTHSPLVSVHDNQMCFTTSIYMMESVPLLVAINNVEYVFCGKLFGKFSSMLFSFDRFYYLGWEETILSVHFVWNILQLYTIGFCWW